MTQPGVSGGGVSYVDYEENYTPLFSDYEYENTNIGVAIDQQSVLQLALTAQSRTLSELDFLKNNIQVCGSWDLGCYATNNQFQAALSSGATVLTSFLIGVGIGIGETLTFAAIFSFILGLLGKVVSIVLSIIGLLPSHT